MSRSVLFLCCLLPFALGLDQRIVGGDDVDIADYPWQGSYRLAGSHSCGCVLVSPGFAVTAAHCGGGLARTVGFGASSRLGLTIINVASFAAHPEYEQGSGAYPNDIALLTLESDASGPNIAPIAMGSSRLNGGEAATITGWGRTCGLCALPVQLQGVDLDVLSDAECDGIWGNNYNGDVHVCVYDNANQAKGACNGDSGGPMVSGGLFHGVTSWGSVGCNTNFASSYTRVTTFRSWICSGTGNAAEGC